jgi:Kef-type K+ transport system membrane component KefB
MLMAGLEMRHAELVEKSKGALLVALGGLSIPLLTGISLGRFFLPLSEASLAQALFIGTALANHRRAGSCQGVDRSEQAKVSPADKMIFSAAIVDDIPGMLLLAVLTAVIQTKTVQTKGCQ